MHYKIKYTYQPLLCNKSYIDDSNKRKSFNDNPASIKYDSSGKILAKYYYDDDHIHRDNDLPSCYKYNYINHFTEVIYFFITKGKLYRKDKPSIIITKQYEKIEIYAYCNDYPYYDFQNIFPENHKDIYGIIHRINGPAVIHYDNNNNITCKYYYLYGKEYSEGQYYRKLDIMSIQK